MEGMVCSVLNETLHNFFTSTKRCSLLQYIDGTRHLSDTFLFDFDSKTWFSLHIDGIPPAPRDSHVSVVHGNSMFVFGGSSGRSMNDFYELQVRIIYIG